MIFQKNQPKNNYINPETLENPEVVENIKDEVETVVGPSVNVEGDFASEGNIIVKGSVAGSVHTSRHLTVEVGARIMANVRAGSAKVSGEVKGNIKAKDSVELTSTARVVGDIEAKVLIVEAGALICGKVSMPGLESTENRGGRIRNKRVEETITTEVV